MSKKEDPEPEPDVEVVAYAEPAAMVAVVAPSTLQAGYTFNAQVDGKDFVVTVPEGGVTEGQQFEVPYPRSAMVGPLFASGGAVAGSAGDVPLQEQQEDQDVIKGMWRKDLLDCFAVLCNGMFWMSWCCNPIIFGQVMERMKLDAFGRVETGKKGTCSIVTTVFLIYLFFCLLGFGIFLWPFFFVYTMLAFSNARYAYRKHYDIKPSLCDGCEGRMDDCCCIFWCGCCVGIQLARHTHDEGQYPYSCCSTTGISESAPEIVV
jgi:Cys-rich protein (TIGR01571 family)